MRVLRDFVAVRVKEKSLNKIKLASGIELYQDDTFRPEWHVATEGEVVAIPDKLSDQYFENKGIATDVRLGDKIYFQFNCIHESNEIESDGEKLYRIDYPSIFAYRRDGEIHMVGSWCFVRPEIEDKGEKIGSIFLPDSVRKETHRDIGTIWKIGKPLAHENNLGLEAGDKILFRQKAAAEYTIEGETLYVMRQGQIMAKIV